LTLHRESIPLLWLVADPADFSLNKLERDAICHFLAQIPAELCPKLVFIADRGYAKTELFHFLNELKMNFVIGVCGKVWITTKNYQGWISKVPLSVGAIKWLPRVLFHKKNGVVLKLLIKYEKDEPLYIVTNLSSPQLVLEIYGRRMLIEEGFRDIKDGLLFKRLKLSRADKVGKMLLVGVLVYLFILIVGAQVLKYRQLIEKISILPKSRESKRLLSVFRIGLLVAGRCESIKFLLHLVPEGD